MSAYADIDRDRSDSTGLHVDSEDIEYAQPRLSMSDSQHAASTPSDAGGQLRFEGQVHSDDRYQSNLSQWE